MITRLLPLLAAFLGAFLATLWLVGSLYRGRREEGVRETVAYPPEGDDGIEPPDPRLGGLAVRGAADYAARVLDLWLTGDEDFTESTVRVAIRRVQEALAT